MSKFKKDGGREMPEMNTSSLPDLIFTILFFFMMVTSMREVTLKVANEKVQGTNLQRIANKNANTAIYIGHPIGSDAVDDAVQINDKIINLDDSLDRIEFRTYIGDAVRKLKDRDKPDFTVSLKVDENAKMGVVTNVKLHLRKLDARQIMYSAKETAQEEEE